MPAYDYDSETELTKYHDEEGYTHDESEEEEENEPMSCFSLMLCCGCICCVLITWMLWTAYRWSTAPACIAGASPMAWNTMIPDHTTLQFVNQFFTFYSKVDVYNFNQTHPSLGYWRDLNVFWATRYAFIGPRGDEEPVLLAQTQPWAFMGGLRYTLWRCGASEEETYRIEEDVWARPWFFNFNREKVFNIIKGTEQIGQSLTRTNNRLVGFLFSSKEIVVVDNEEATLANIDQESQLQAGFSNRRFFVENHQRDIIPNEVVSFLAAVWELNGVSENSDDHASSSSSSRRRR